MTTINTKQTLAERAASLLNRAMFYAGLFVVGPCYGAARFLWRTALRAVQAVRWML